MLGMNSIREFWDRAAERKPYWYVSSAVPYGGSRDMGEFWQSGVNIWREITTVTGYQPAASHTVVEIGCGVGRLTRAISREVGRVVAIDVSEKMISIAQEVLLPNVDFVLGDGASLAGVADASADMVLAYCVYQHLPSNRALGGYLSEMIRVAKPGAVVAFTLVPRTWRRFLMPAMRARAYLRQLASENAPAEVHRREWVGIRPSHTAVCGMCPVALRSLRLGEERVIYYGARPAARPGPTRHPTPTLCPK